MATQPASLDLLQFDDSTSCKQWVTTLPLTNAPAAQQSLTRQIVLATQAGLPAVEFLKILEALREPAVHVQREAAVKYAGKALPLEKHEFAAWERTVFLWQELAHAYLACHDAGLRGEAGLKPYGALITLRGLQYTGRAMLEYYRVHYQPPAALWRELHRLYTLSEQGNFAHTAVPDIFNRGEPNSSCTAVFCRALLTQLANPFALTARQLDFVDRWLDGWAPLVGLKTGPPPASTIPLLAVDLAGDSGAVAAQNPGPLPGGLRHLDLEQLGHVLRQLIALLKQGQSPAQLGLGDARQPGCEGLLTLLYIQWCRAGTGRGEQRTTTSTEKAQVCLGMPAVHFYIGGRAFRPPGRSLSRQEEQDLQLFGRVSERTERMLASGENMAVESWRLANHSDAGFMCMLRDTDTRARIGHHQLVAVRRGGGTPFQAGVVQWLRVDENNDLFVGVRLFPGVARAVTVRPVNFKLPGANGFERALLLPELPLPVAPATLVLPSGWYQAGRFVDVLHGEQKQVAKLEGLFEKGGDFDRCIVSLN